MTSFRSTISQQRQLPANALIALVDDIAEHQLAINSFMLLQNGDCMLQWHRNPYRSDCPQLLFSLSKSITSIAVGIAWDRGLLDLDDAVISFFPDKLPTTVTPNLARMTVRHLLSMTAGHEDNIYAAVAKEQDWASAFLSQHVPHGPGTRYRYSTHSTYMLAAIIERVTGIGLVDFLMPALFEPLAIPRPSWEKCPMGITAGGMGLSLTTESIAKFGLLLLNNGLYEGKRIVSETYIRMATSEQSDNRAEAAPGRVDSAQGYGYQIHLCRKECYRGDGSFGQLCFVAPNEQIVIAATASFTSMNELQSLLNLIYEHIIDRIDEEGSLSHDDDQVLLQRVLLQRVAQLSEGIDINKPYSDRTASLDGAAYTLSGNPHGLRQIRFFEQDDLLEMQMVYGDERNNVLPFSWIEPIAVYDVFNKDLSLHRQEVITSASWLDSRTLELKLVYIETPYVVTYKIVFIEDSAIHFQFSINVSLNIPEYRVEGIRTSL
ncbi:serine hydrolase domain-containing protein [Paenibacillus kobensis]|uniref:serine hydrolase domain-containing protein n=1 Tax=Paenibacillus kobensis TaxID=59841 RepID=UPI000FDC6C75|nr:serine hydrolase [Paenibacillus kobensis]